jgi:hypothetical protein
MKSFIYNYCVIGFIFFIIILIYFVTLENVEGFTPTIRQMYRPYIRKARIIGEGFLSEQTINITNLFRKFGIL